jgi:hypothetical protein
MPNGPVDVAAGAPNPQSYTSNGDGTVTDGVTGLMWQQSVPATLLSWSDAVASCQSLTLAGHADWRLPSLIELVSIVDPSIFSPSINAAAFPSTPRDAAFWSSTSSPSAPGNAFSVFFVFGNAISSAQSTLNHTRCVR